MSRGEAIDCFIKQSIRSNRLPLWAINWSLGQLENPINTVATYSNYSECHFSYTTLQIINQDFQRAFSLSRRTLTSPVLLEVSTGVIEVNTDQWKPLKVTARNTNRKHTHTWRVSLKVLSLTRVNRFTISSIS